MSGAALETLFSTDDAVTLRSPFIPVHRHSLYSCQFNPTMWKLLTWRGAPTEHPCGKARRRPGAERPSEESHTNMIICYTRLERCGMGRSRQFDLARRGGAVRND